MLHPKWQVKNTKNGRKKKNRKQRPKAWLKMQKSLIFVVFLALFFSYFLLIFSHFLVYFDDILATFCVKKNGFWSDSGTHFDTSGLHFWEQVDHIISRPLRRLSQ